MWGFFMKSKANTKKDKTFRVLLIIGLLSLAFLIVIILQFFILENRAENVVGNGVVINGNKLAGMNTAEACEYVSSYFNEMAEDFKLTIRDKDNVWILTKEDFEVNSDIFSIIEASQEHKKELDTKEKQLNMLNMLIKEGASINVAFNYIFVGLDEKIEEIVSQVEIAPINSEIIFKPDEKDMFEITDSVNGMRVDRVKLYDDINSQFIKTNKINVMLHWVEQEAEITKEYNKNLTTKISGYSTNVSDSTGGRKTNVKLALNKFNGMRINPKEEISFNKITGPHTLASGYQMATIIYNSRFVEGVGGGICQASTTLYNALIRAGVDIIEVNKHTLPVRYVPLACDAMVAEYISDLRFINNSEYPIFIKTFSDEEKVGVEIYGHALEDGISYDLVSETIKILPHGGDVIKQDIEKEYVDKVLYKGEFYRLSYPRDGVEAKAYLNTYKNGELIDSVCVRHEKYKPQNGILIEGVEEKPAEFNNISDDIEIINENKQVDLNNLDFMHGTVPTNVCP